MKAGIIAPIAMLEKYATQSDYHLVLAHLVHESVEYREFYKARSDAGDFITLDNSLIELGHPMPLPALLEAAELVGASEIILPDRFADLSGTLAVTFASYHTLVNMGMLGRYKLMVVPQGNDALSWLYCYWLFSNTPHFDTIGIAKHTETFCKGGRPALLHALIRLEARSPKEHHLLGVWSSPLEVFECSRSFGWLRSVDTSLPVLAGLHGIQFPDPLRGITFERPAKPLDFKATEDPHHKITERNVRLYLRWAQGG